MNEKRAQTIFIVVVVVIQSVGDENETECEYQCMGYANVSIIIIMIIIDVQVMSSRHMAWPCWPQLAYIVRTRTPIVNAYKWCGEMDIVQTYVFICICFMPVCKIEMQLNTRQQQRPNINKICIILFI